MNVKVTHACMEVVQIILEALYVHVTLGLQVHTNGAERCVTSNINLLHCYLNLTSTPYGLFF